MDKVEEARNNAGIPIKEISAYDLEHCVVSTKEGDFVVSGSLGIVPKMAFPQRPGIKLICGGETSFFDPGNTLGRYTEVAFGIFEKEDYDEPAHRNLPRTSHTSVESAVIALLTYARIVETEKEADKNLAGLVKKE